MPPFYTRTGDEGTTGILGSERLPKHHPRIEALGTLDEASAALGLARSLACVESTRSILLHAQRDLYALMAETASEPENAPKFRTLGMDRVQWLETQADAVSSRVPPPREFIVPGDSPGGAALSVARTVVRRAERRLSELIHSGIVENEALLPYLNRLSSLLFILEIEENQVSGRSTTLAKE